MALRGGGMKGAYQGSLSKLEDMIELSSLGDSIEIHKGLIQGDKSLGI